MAFHLRDNWFFERRTEDGDVRIYHEDLEADQDDGFVEYDVCLDIDPASWASIVASVSKLGETAETYQHAIATHQGDISWPINPELVQD